MPFIKESLTMTIINVENPEQKIEILTVISQAVEKNHLSLLQILDKKEKLYLIFDKLDIENKENLLNYYISSLTCKK